MNLEGITGKIDHKLTSTSERPVRRPRFDEDTLVRALDFCDEFGLRFGQFLANVLTEYLIEQNIIPPAVTAMQKAALIERSLFYMENGSLREAAQKYIEKHRARRDAINNIAQDAVTAGLYDKACDSNCRECQA